MSYKSTMMMILRIIKKSLRVRNKKSKKIFLPISKMRLEHLIYLQQKDRKLQMLSSLLDKAAFILKFNIFNSNVRFLLALSVLPN